MEEQKEALKDLFDRFENFSSTSIELYKLKLIGKTSSILASLTISIVVLIISLFFISFINIALALYIGKWMGNYGLGFLIVSSFYLLLTCLVYFFRSNISENLIENLLLRKFLSKENKNESK